MWTPVEVGEMEGREGGREEKGKERREGEREEMYNIIHTLKVHKNLLW